MCKTGPDLSAFALDCQSLADSDLGADGIAAGSDGALWIAERNGNGIHRVATNFDHVDYPLPHAASNPVGITAGPDGALWFTEILGNRIGRITTGGTIKEFDLPNANSDPTGITAGPDGALWFTEAAGNRIGRITTSGAITEFPIPTANAGARGIVTGPDGKLWFTEETAGKIGRLDPAPAASVALAGGTPLTGHILALNPTGSKPGSAAISHYAYDLDGSGRFDAICPPNAPLAYKMFDTPGSHVIGLQAIDVNGLKATTHLALNITGKAIRRAHASADPKLAELTHFWCGDKSALSRIDTSYLPPLFTSSVKAVGVDVTQGVEPSPPKPSFLSIIARKLLPFRDISVAGSVFLRNDQENPRDHQVTWLQKGGKTIVRVYASSLIAPNGSSVRNVQMKLYGVGLGGGPSGSGNLPGSPLISQTGPLTVPVGPPFTTHAMRISYDALDGNLPVFTFTLPDSWTAGRIGLLAVPTLVGPRLDRQCDTLTCKLNQQGGANVEFNNTGLTIVRSVAMTATGDAALPSPSTIFDSASNLSPNATLPTPYQGTISIDPITTCKAGDKSTPCTNPNGYATTLIGNWTAANYPAVLSLIKVSTIGVHKGYSQINGYSSWPGGCTNIPAGGALCENETVTPISQVDAGRPITSVAHEMFHDLGRNHADDSSASACGGNGDGKPDARGHTQAIGLDRHAGSGGSVKNPYKIISSDLPGQPAEEFDLMSYCTDNYPETNSWESEYDWDGIAGDWIFFEKRALQGSFRRSPIASLAAAGPTLHVTGSTIGGTTSITQVIPAKTGASAAIAAAPKSSLYHAVVRNGTGAVVGDVPLGVEFGHLDGKVPTPVATFDGIVPAGGAATQVQIVRAGTTIATKAKSAHAPTVKSLSPRRGTIGKRHTVKVRWKASDADGDPLMARVDYSINNGKTWRTVFSGPSKGTTTLPSRYFTGSTRARIRVAVNDGFNEATVKSGKLRAVGSRPTISILDPRRNEKTDADGTLFLHATAFDDALRHLTGRHLRWTTGKRKLGSGEALGVTRLKPGKVKITLRATDRNHRSASKSVTVRVQSVRPFFTRLTVPKKLSSRTRTVKLRVATNLATTLSAGGKHFKVGTKTKTVRVPIKRGSSTLSLRLGLKAFGRSAAQTLKIPR